MDEPSVVSSNVQDIDAPGELSDILPDDENVALNSLSEDADFENYSQETTVDEPSVISSKVQDIDAAGELSDIFPDNENVSLDSLSEDAEFESYLEETEFPEMVKENMESNSLLTFVFWLLSAFSLMYAFRLRNTIRSLKHKIRNLEQQKRILSSQITSLQETIKTCTCRKAVHNCHNCHVHN